MLDFGSMTSGEINLLIVQALGVFVTALMAGATAWLGWEARRTRRQAQDQRDREAFRLALLELGDQVLVWSAAAPWSGSAAERVRESVDLATMRQALATLSMPADLLTYLLWSVIAVRSTSETYIAILRYDIPGNYPPIESPTWYSSQAQDMYAATLGQMLLAGRLMCAEAARRGFEEIRTAFGAQFSRAPYRKPDLRSLETYGRPLPNPPHLPEIAEKIGHVEELWWGVGSGRRRSDQDPE